MDLIDLHGIDYETIGNSVKKTGAVIILEEAPYPVSRRLEESAIISNTIIKDFIIKTAERSWK